MGAVITGVGVALPDIQNALGFSPEASPQTTGMTEPTAAAIGATTPARPIASHW